MSDIKFQFEWEDPQGARGSELRATWARLSILAGNEPVTRLIDESSKGFRDAVYGPLYPVAEWIAMNWWSLFHEVEAPGTQRWRSYALRHSLCYAGEGFVLPDFRIKPSGRMTDLNWFPRAFPKAGVSFVEAGNLSVPTGAIQNELFDFVSSVVARLLSENVVGTPLQEEWNAILSMAPEETAFCETAAALGEDPFAMEESDRAELLEIAGALPGELFGEFVAATDFNKISESLADLKNVLEQVGDSTASLPSLATLRDQAPAIQAAATPWDQGYEFARSLRDQIGLNGHLLNSDRELATALSTDVENLRDAILTPLKSQWEFDALVGTASDGNPVFATSKRHVDSQRFAVCRGLFEYLTQVDGERSALVSRAFSDRQRANRAFAAEFLAPEKLLRQRISFDTLDGEQIDDLAEEFGVYSMVIRHQVENHQIAKIVT
jgi:hypothetical protein